MPGAGSSLSHPYASGGACYIRQNRPPAVGVNGGVGTNRQGRTGTSGVIVVRMTGRPQYADWIDEQRLRRAQRIKRLKLAAVAAVVLVAVLPFAVALGIAGSIHHKLNEDPAAIAADWAHRVSLADLDENELETAKQEECDEAKPSAAGLRATFKAAVARARAEGGYHFEFLLGKAKVTKDGRWRASVPVTAIAELFNVPMDDGITVQHDYIVTDTHQWTVKLVRSVTRPRWRVCEIVEDRPLFASK